MACHHADTSGVPDGPEWARLFAELEAAVYGGDVAGAADAAGDLVDLDPQASGRLWDFAMPFLEVALGKREPLSRRAHAAQSAALAVLAHPSCPHELLARVLRCEQDDFFEFVLADDRLPIEAYPCRVARARCEDELATFVDGLGAEVAEIAEKLAADFDGSVAELAACARALA